MCVCICDGLCRSLTLHVHFWETECRCPVPIYLYICYPSQARPSFLCMVFSVMFVLAIVPLPGRWKSYVNPASRIFRINGFQSVGAHHVCPTVAPE